MSKSLSLLTKNEQIAQKTNERIPSPEELYFLNPMRFFHTETLKGSTGTYAAFLGAKSNLF